MPPEAPAPGWRERARLLTADLLVFDAKRLGWVLALRTMIGLLVPLLLARWLEMPSLIWVGIGAYLLAIGDSMDDGDRHQKLRLAIGALLGGLALASGVLAGTSLPLAVAGMLFWGLLTGLMGVYGNAFATMSLPIAWAYAELGLPGGDHSLSHALYLGGLFALGGGLTLVLTLALRFGGPHARVKAQVAACYRAAADYFEPRGPRGAISPETRVRSAIAEARRMASQVRGAAQASSRANQRHLVLIEMADRLFSLTGAFLEEGRTPPPLFREAALAIASALEGKAPESELRALMTALDSHAAGAPPAFGTGVLENRLGRELSHALHILLGGEAPALPLAQPAPGARLSQILAPLIQNLDWNSVVARHALRFAVVAAVAVMIFWVFPKPFGYWVPLTVTVVLKPYAGMTLARAVQRLAGTTAGILLGMAVMPLLPTPALQLVVVAVAFFCMMAVLPFNYSLAIFFLSAGLIPFEHVLTPGLGLDVGPMRLLATGIGAVLALVGGHLLWPTFERRSLPHLLQASVSSMAAYADLVLDAAEGRTDVAAAEAARRRAGLDTTNLQAALQRAMTEIGGEPGAMQATIRASTALQQLSRTLNALMNAAPALARQPVALTPFRTAFASALAGLGTGAPPTSTATLRAAVPGQASDEDTFLGRELERLISEFEMLRDALSAPPQPVFGASGEAPAPGKAATKA